MESNPSRTSSTVPTADAGPSSTDISHEHIPDEIAKSLPTRNTALTELQFLDQLFIWATNARDHPEEFFTEAGLSEIDPPAQKVPDEADPYGVRAQEDLDSFRELLDWAENMVEQDRVKRSRKLGC
jgi:hypothetical protein